MVEKGTSGDNGGLVIMDEDTAENIANKLLAQNALAEVRNEDDFQPNTPVTVVVPGSGFWEQEEDSIQTEFRFLEGDLSPILTNSPFGAIRFELNDLQDHHDDYFKEVVKRGGRFFVTESDSHLIVHTEKSLQYREGHIASKS